MSARFGLYELIQLVRNWRWWNRSASARCHLAVHPAEHFPHASLRFCFDVRDTQPGTINTHPALNDGTDEEMFPTDRRSAGGEDRERGGA